MSRCTWLRLNSALYRSLTGCALIAGCTSTVPLKPAFDEPPLFPQIQARVGTLCKDPVHSADYVQGLFRIDFDRASLSRFEQVFQSLFAEVTPLPAWPPWRETPPELDAVIELDKSELTVTLGDDNRTPERVAVTYRVCLYTPDGGTINCWESRAEQSHQRAVFESILSLDSYLATLVETASREAIARFMLAFERDPAVMAWAEQVANRQRTP